MELIKLIGILIIVVGFVLKLDTIAVVLLSALVTALVSDISFTAFLGTLGEAFVSNRMVTLFLLTLPMIGLSERFGLRQVAVVIIEKIKSLTPGRFLIIYLFIREIAGLFSIRIQGQTQFIRPIVNPMAQAAAENKYGKLSEKDQEKIKARSAATENFGNFFAQNTFIAASGVLLIVGTMDSLGYKVLAGSVSKASIPIAIIILVVVALYNLLFDRKMMNKYKDKGEQK
ncbi:membrane protein [Bacilli bacterium]|nr:membrane protein [Bacilli bacterium]